MDPLAAQSPFVSGPPVTTPESQLAAYEHMVADSAQGTGTFVGIASFIGLFVRPKAPHTAEKLVHSLTSLNLPHPAAPKPALPRPGRNTLLYLAPAPLGTMPPEVYGIRPDYLSKNAHLDDTGTYGTLLGIIGGNPGKERVQYAQQHRADKYEQELAALLPKLPTKFIESILVEFSDPAWIAHNTQLRPAILQRIVRDELIRRGADFAFLGADLNLPRPGTAPDSIPSPLDLPAVVRPPVVAPATVQAIQALFGPAAAAAVRPLESPPDNNLQREAAERAPELLKHIVSERADP